MAETQKLIDKSEGVLSRIRAMLYTQFTEDNKIEIENEVKACLEEYCEILILVRNGEIITSASDLVFLDDIFNDIFVECRKLLQIYERQKLIEKFQLLKQKFLQISTMDTSKNFVRDLDKEAEEFKKNLEANKYLNICCLDLLQELEVFIKRIKSALKNVKVQVAMEAATGVLTLGSAVASGAVGIAGAVASTGSAAVSGAASAAGGAAKGVAKTAKAAAVAVDVIDTAASSSGQIGLPASNSMAIAISTSKAAKCVLKTVDAASGLVGAVAKVNDILNKTKTESKEKKIKMKAKEVCFNVSEMVIELDDSLVEYPDFSTTILAKAIFERLMDI